MISADATSILVKKCKMDTKKAGRPFGRPTLSGIHFARFNRGKTNFLLKRHLFAVDDVDATLHHLLHLAAGEVVDSGILVCHLDAPCKLR